MCAQKLIEMYHNISKMHPKPIFVIAVTHKKHLGVTENDSDHKNTMN
ncbi:hypothetical protein VCRA2119O240_20161 [Vibrio crassostreae]|nr:hypothetical protein VCRA2113O198_20161 [Vibrio crassostreae]CAK2003160.1 hypothetical protein VCRA2110O178_20161 [Vibrio crassostreae]CAK2014789.1 hypothetical protein VCRA2112O189_20160 [Vibrio crassostreae]CAK2100260.1 hypothetical protein VCRA2113O212_30210 [Vibrio crassostreae]CAK2481948.1 hypothetical protein VCRA2110O179_20209 [Vibrio crassostreae]